MKSPLFWLTAPLDTTATVDGIVHALTDQERAQ